uniref:hypothetical protein n=1 Tax=Pseudarthrobacter oxydans TaxID=1671 RepID=UPI003F494346
MSTKWKTIIAIAAIAVIVAVAVVLINRPAEQAAQPEPSSDSGRVAGTLGFPVSKINIGEGGTKTAADGKTPTGYNGTCDSAVQAAANYVPLVSEVNLETWAEQKKTLTQVSMPGPWLEKVTSGGDLLTTTKDLPGAFDGGWVSRSDVAAGGMYRVASCEEKKRAVIQVFIGSLNAQVKTVPAGGFGTVPMELSWDGDWKIMDARQSADDPDFGGRVKDRGPGGSAPGEPTGDFLVLNQDLVHSVFGSVGRDGWVEYANAKRK